MAWREGEGAVCEVAIFMIEGGVVVVLPFKARRRRRRR